MAIDPMFKLEHGSDDTVKGQKAKANLSIIESMRQDKKDDYLLNKLARHKFRVGIKWKWNIKDKPWYMKNMCFYEFMLKSWVGTCELIRIISCILNVLKHKSLMLV